MNLFSSIAVIKKEHIMRGKIIWNITMLMILTVVFSSCKKTEESVEPQFKNMSLIAKVNTDGFASGVFVQVINNKSYAFVADGGSGLYILDVSFPSVPSIVVKFNTSGYAHDVFVSYINNIPFAFISDGYKGLMVLNVSNPAAPVKTDSMFFPQDAVLTAFIDTVNNKAYAGTYKGFVKILELSNLPNQLTQIASYDAFDKIGGLYVTGGMCYIAEPDYGLEILNVTNPSNPHIVGYLPTLDDANDVTVGTNMAYVADGLAGITVIDVTYPSNPVYLGTASAKSYVGSIFLRRNKLYITEPSYAIEEYSLNSLYWPSSAGYYVTTGTPVNVFAFGNFIYLADGEDGLYIFTSQ